MDNMPYDIFCMKEPECVMKIMMTHGGLIVNEDQKISNTIFNVGDDYQVASFKYTEPFSNHFDLRHIVDYHNNLRHAILLLNETWLIQSWAVRFFHSYWMLQK